MGNKFRITLNERHDFTHCHCGTKWNQSIFLSCMLLTFNLLNWRKINCYFVVVTTFKEKEGLQKESFPSFKRIPFQTTGFNYSNRILINFLRLMLMFFFLLLFITWSNDKLLLVFKRYDKMILNILNYHWHQILNLILVSFYLNLNIQISFDGSKQNHHQGQQFEAHLICLLL